MHPLATDKIVEQVRQRASEGDRPTIPAQSIEVLEGVVLELARQLDFSRMMQRQAAKMMADPDIETDNR